MSINKDLVAASSTPLVLAILADGDSYGYAILQRVRELSGGEMQWTDGMLYPGPSPAGEGRADRVAGCSGLSLPAALRLRVRGMSSGTRATSELRTRMTTMNALAEFLFPAPARRNAPAIIVWWERRRLAYNAWVGAAGLISMGTVGVVNMLGGGEAHLREALLFAAVFGGLANVCYFFGPATELFLQKLWAARALPAGPMLYRMGLTFSVGLALLPTLLTVILTTLRVIVGVLGVQGDVA